MESWCGSERISELRSKLPPCGALFKDFYSSEMEPLAEPPLSGLAQEVVEVVAEHFGLPLHLVEFAKRAMNNFDPGHQWDHGITVYLNALQIIEAEQIELDETSAKMLPYVMIGHDFRDHKMLARGIEMVSQEDIRAYYEEHLGKALADEVIHIHNNCSWSNRAASKPYHKDRRRDVLRKILQDADWLEALGYGGIWRCQVYLEFFGPLPGEDGSKDPAATICEHIYEKLLRIPIALNFRASRIVAEHFGVYPLLTYLHCKGKLVFNLALFPRVSQEYYRTNPSATPIVDHIALYYDHRP